MQANTLRIFNRLFFLVWKCSWGINSPKTGYGHSRAQVKGSCEPLVTVSGSTEWKAQNITWQKHILTTQEFNEYWFVNESYVFSWWWWKQFDMCLRSLEHLPVLFLEFLAIIKEVITPLGLRCMVLVVWHFATGQSFHSRSLRGFCCFSRPSWHAYAGVCAY